ncbi:DUF3561 family protein [Salmonella enterica]|uniref:DUF3561 family protein n=1 Tax=Salmonella enterica TaxID=28901 RepID=UPI00398C7B2E
MPVSVIIGIALHLLVKGKILVSIMFTLLAVGALFGALFIWPLGLTGYHCSSVHNSNRKQQ